jgi:hypothetical protein
MRSNLPAVLTLDRLAASRESPTAIEHARSFAQQRRTLEAL